MHNGLNTVLISLWQDLEVTPVNVAEVAKILKADEEDQDLNQEILQNYSLLVCLKLLNVLGRETYSRADLGIAEDTSQRFGGPPGPETAVSGPGVSLALCPLAAGQCLRWSHFPSLQFWDI